MKKVYVAPYVSSTNVQVMAAPLAFFSAATAAAAAVGVAVGAAGTKLAIKASPDEKKHLHLSKIRD